MRATPGDGTSARAPFLSVFNTGNRIGYSSIMDVPQFDVLARRAGLESGDLTWGNYPHGNAGVASLIAREFASSGQVCHAAPS